MATTSGESGVRTIDVIAGAAVSKGRYLARDSTGRYQHCAAGLVPDGVATEAASGAGISIAMAIMNGAMIPMESGAAMATDGVLVKSDSTGRAIAYTVGAGISAAGRLAGTAGAAGEYPVVQIFNSGSPASTTG